MRAIDNYTDKEREVLALKGMTAPRTASEHTEHDCNKAQHSPLPWHLSAYHKVIARSRGDATICDCTNPVFADQREQEENAKLIVRAVNHADKLAEELRQVLKHGSAGNENLIREALAAYEENR